MLLYLSIGAAPPFWGVLLLILGVGWAAGGAVREWAIRPAWRWGHATALFSLLVVMLLLVGVHTRLQINFFEHFSLGHADFGHFTEELKNALAGRGLRCDSFPNTRFGWHFVPLLYALVPGYALFPTPYYLMVCGALFVHMPAIVAYFFARRMSGSVLVGWLFGMAWLLLPSQSRLVYSNTYGFQWIYCSMWMLALLVAATASARWRWSVCLVVLLLLCKETVAAATLGWGLAVLLFTARRGLGAGVVVLSVVYLWLCTAWLIPHFSVSGEYQRAELFGALGNSMAEVLSSPVREPGMFFKTLFRAESAYFLATILVTMGLLPFRAWRMALMCIPTLALVLLLANPAWLSLKFWHQCTVLPFLFFAGIAGLRSSKLTEPNTAGLEMGDDGQHTAGPGAKAAGEGPSRTTSLRLASVAFMCAAMGHYFFAFSPLSKAFEPYAAVVDWHRPDPRLQVVQRLRAEIPRTSALLATERLAAHFTDFRRLYTGRRAGAADAAAYVLIDAADLWDTSDLARQGARFERDACFELMLRAESISAFRRRVGCPAAELD